MRVTVFFFFFVCLCLNSILRGSHGWTLSYLPMEASTNPFNANVFRPQVLVLQALSTKPRRGSISLSLSPFYDPHRHGQLIDRPRV